MCLHAHNSCQTRPVFVTIIVVILIILSVQKLYHKHDYQMAVTKTEFKFKFTGDKARKETETDINAKRLRQIKKTCDKMRKSKAKEVVTFNAELEKALYSNEFRTWRWNFGEIYFVPDDRQSLFIEKLEDSYSPTYKDKDTVVQKYYDQLKKFFVPNDNLFCIPPKTGTTNWRRNLILLYYQNQAAVDNLMMAIKDDHENYNSNFTDPLKIKLPEHLMGDTDFFNILPRLSNENLFHNRQKYLFTDKNRKKVLNVRHPVERLYSAWHQKFAKNHWKVEKFRKNFLNKNNIPKTTH